MTGVDISQPMLALARSRAQAKNIRFIEADASAYPFKPDYDLIFSRFGVMFFVDPAAAFANIRKAAAKDGRLAFVCWRAVEEMNGCPCRTRRRNRSAGTGAAIRMRPGLLPSPIPTACAVF